MGQRIVVLLGGPDNIFQGRDLRFVITNQIGTVRNRAGIQLSPTFAGDQVDFGVGADLVGRVRQLICRRRPGLDVLLLGDAPPQRRTGETIAFGADRDTTSRLGLLDRVVVLDLAVDEADPDVGLLVRVGQGDVAKRHRRRFRRCPCLGAGSVAELGARDLGDLGEVELGLGAPYRRQQLPHRRRTDRPRDGSQTPDRALLVGHDGVDDRPVFQLLDQNARPVGVVFRQHQDLVILPVVVGVDHDPPDAIVHHRMEGMAGPAHEPEPEEAQSRDEPAVVLEGLLDAVLRQTGKVDLGDAVVGRRLVQVVQGVVQAERRPVVAKLGLAVRVFAQVVDAHRIDEVAVVVVAVDGAEHGAHQFIVSILQQRVEDVRRHPHPVAVLVARHVHTHAAQERHAEMLPDQAGAAERGAVAVAVMKRGAVGVEQELAIVVHAAKSDGGLHVLNTRAAILCPVAVQRVEHDLDVGPLPHHDGGEDGACADHAGRELLSRRNPDLEGVHTYLASLKAKKMSSADPWLKTSS